MGKEGGSLPGSVRGWENLAELKGHVRRSFTHPRWVLAFGAGDGNGGFQLLTHSEEAKSWSRGWDCSLCGKWLGWEGHSGEGCTWREGKIFRGVSVGEAI